MQNETTSFSGYPNATPLSRPMGGGTPYPIGDEDDPDEMNAALFNEIMDDKQRQAPHYKKPNMDLHRRMDEMRELEDMGRFEDYPDEHMGPDHPEPIG